MSGSDPLLTIAVLARNRPDYLRKMLASVMEASNPETTVIVRDHSDDERSRLVVEELASNHRDGARLRHQHAMPKGQRENVLGAVRECETEFLCILNDDDLIEPVLVSELLPPLIADPSASFSTGNFLCIDSQGAVVRRLRPVPFSRGYATFPTPSDRAKFHVVERQMRPFMGTIFRIGALCGIELPKEAPTLPDLWVARHIADTGSRGWCTDTTVFQYRIHTDSVSGAMNDLDGYRWSMGRFLDDELFTPFRAELHLALRQYERTVLIGQFVRGDRSSKSVQDIIDVSEPMSHARRAVTRLALRRPFDSLTCRYLQFTNPRLKSERIAEVQPPKGILRKVHERR